ncbi:hypothetical protein HYPSUDRAFT_35183 [Hypholoma sublateritium FD-334 SS-4]|uniref:FAS1 domain-containing protein n=1 Tax=Hypholoma sublateritium (strain FD-334 SS-4) TaxID=945553 RepID=A0A0D2LI62_HYPSF|nr:hypothetical protein HYPSUDRAFT_35183 [Hypholoma sublateritium FD-334 SS-4]
MRFRDLSYWLLFTSLIRSSSAAHTNQEGLVQLWNDPSEIHWSTRTSISKDHHNAEPAASTIYGVLSSDPRFSLITKAITFVEDIAAILKDSTSELTFFAPPDRVFQHSNIPASNISLSAFGTRGLTNGALDYSLISLLSQFRDLAEILPLIEEFTSNISHATKDEAAQQIALKTILRAILSYHILPRTAYDLASLGENVTYPTQLRVTGAFSGEPLSLRFTQGVLPLTASINFVTKILHPDIKAANGIIHVVDRALRVPRSVFQELYASPRFFSTLTSALQISNLTDNVDLRFSPSDGLKGTSAVTIFAPTNRAFEALPENLQLFLFSSSGKRTMKKLLQYHIVPNTVVQSNYRYDVVVDAMNPGGPDNHPLRRNHASFKPTSSGHVEPMLPIKVTMNTMPESHPIDAQIVQDKLSFTALSGHKKHSIFDVKIIVDGRPATVTDIVCLNGAVHAVDRVFDPRKSDHRRGPVKPPIAGPRTSLFGRSWGHSANCINGVEDRGCAGVTQHHFEDERKEVSVFRRKYGRLFPKRRRDGYNPDHHSEHFDIEDNGPLYDSWVDWENWLPQWGEQG